MSTPSKTFICRHCEAERTVEANSQGWFDAPQDWAILFIHEPGKRRPVGHTCSTYCTLCVLGEMATTTNTPLTAVDGTGRWWFCRGCNARYQAQEPRPGSVSVAVYLANGSRKFNGPFCDAACGIVFFAAELEYLVERSAA